MFTRCPSCSSTFRVTAAVLQMAQGEVRCGSCGAVFNALHTLLDDWSGADFSATGAARLGPPEPVAPAAPEPGAEPPGETLEFDVPENEWQRYFITPAEPAPPDDRREPALGDDFEEAADAPAPARRSLEEETSDTDTWQAFLRETEAAVEPGDRAAPERDEDQDEDDAPAFVVGDDAGPGEALPVLVRVRPEPPPPEEEVAEISVTAEHLVLVDGPAGAAEPPGQPPGDEPSPELEPEPGPPRAGGPPPTVLDWGPPPAFTAEAAAAADPRTGRWLAASLLAALALGAQLVHYSRDSLAADPTYGPVVRDLYGRLGTPLHPDWPLDAFEIRGAKAIAENSAPGALDIVAEIAVNGPQPVGLPMVRVVLRDRWSNAVASGVFDASQYLAEAAPAARIYAPGTLIPVQITLQDPGSAAQGYELDVCVPSRVAGLQCKAARDPFRR